MNWSRYWKGAPAEVIHAVFHPGEDYYLPYVRCRFLTEEYARMAERANPARHSSTYRTRRLNRPLSSRPSGREETISDYGSTMRLCSGRPGQLNGHFVARQDADVVSHAFTGDVCSKLRDRFQLYAEHGIR